MQQYKSSKICAISVTYWLETTGLLGGTWEYAPYVSSFATFGAYRVETVDPLMRGRGGQTEGAHSLSMRRLDAAFFPLSKKSEKPEEKELSEITQRERSPETYSSTLPLAYTLDDWDAMRGEDALKFQLFAHTQFSGVAFLDKQEARHVVRERPAGSCELQLVHLFRLYAEEAARNPEFGRATTGVLAIDGVEFVDDKIVEEKMRSLAGLRDNEDLTPELRRRLYTQARDLTVKARIHFDVALHNFDHALYRRSIFAQKNLTKTGLHSLLPVSKHSLLSQNETYAGREDVIVANKKKKKNVLETHDASFRPILYNSEKSWHLMAATMTSLLESYCNAFVKLSPEHRPRHEPSELQIGNLQLPMYVSPEGRTRVDRYWGSAEPFFRQYHSAEARDRDLRLYELTEQTEQHLLLMLRTALRSLALREDAFVRAIDAHFSPANESRTVSGDFLQAEEAVARIGTLAANMSYYTSDYRLINTAEKKKKSGDGGGQLTVRVLQGDSWDHHIVNNTSMCDDCDGEDMTATAVIRQFIVGRRTLGHRWQSAALNAVQRLLRQTPVFDVGALVTSAFMNNDNKKMELQQSDELPMIGDEMDRRAQNDGHCFALMMPLSRVAAMAERGNVPSMTVETMKRDAAISAAFEARDAQRSTLTLEATGAIEPRLLPIDEAYAVDATLRRKKTAEKYFSRAYRAELKARGEKAEKRREAEEKALAGKKNTKALAELERRHADEVRHFETFVGMFWGESQAHYVQRQSEKRRLSSFYNSIVQATSICLNHYYGNTQALTQFAFCKQVQKKQKYGVRMGELLRDASSTGLSLVAPFVDYPVDRWQSDVLPMVESIENQSSVMKFGRYTEQEQAQVYSIFVSPQEARDGTFAFSDVTKLAAQPERERARLAFEEKLFAAGADAKRSVVRLYSRAWRLDADREIRQEAIHFLTCCKGMVEFALYVERHLPVCHPIVQFLCIIDVDACISLQEKK